MILYTGKNWRQVAAALGFSEDMVEYGEDGSLRIDGIVLMPGDWIGEEDE